VTRQLAIEYAKEAFASTPLLLVSSTHYAQDDPKDFLKTLQPMGRFATVKDVVDAVLYLARADQVTGEVLHVDGGAHAGRCSLVLQPEVRQAAVIVGRRPRGQEYLRSLSLMADR